MRYLKWILVGFVIYCGFLIVESGIFITTPQENDYPILLQQPAGGDSQEISEAPQQEPSETPANIQLSSAETVSFSAEPGDIKTVTIGSTDRESEYKFQLELSSKGAAIQKTTLSEFNDRNPKNPLPLDIITPLRQSNSNELLAMSNAEFLLFNYDKLLRLQNLHWQISEPEPSTNDSQSVHFTATITNQNNNEPLIKITKTFTIHKNSYLLDCDITVENLSETEQNISFNLNGPLGLGREGFRSDMRAVLGGFRNSKQQVIVEAFDKKILTKAKNNIVAITPEDEPSAKFIWAAAVNKYFAAIIVPLPDNAEKTYCDWIQQKNGLLFNPDGDEKNNSGDETVGLLFSTSKNILAAMGQSGNSKTYNFKLYIGPKDKSIFDSNEQYIEWGFVDAITFMPCCCPCGLIRPLALGIVAIMKWMHGFWPHNYGIVIIILVFFMRLLIHPLTKKSQVSMSKMSKLAPRAEEIKKKYANNKAEMNKQMMALYREQGASPIMGMLPMFIQMPVWVALWSAVYASIDLRGAGFLPFWITDLSVPDALIPFSKALVIPLIGWKVESINLLPILMGVAFYLQQRLMPTQANAATNPQMAQQQKMMKIMMPLMFPIFLYKAPSGVNLYIMSSTFAGVIEQYVIRKHIREKEEEESKGLVAVTKKTGGKVKKKKPKPFFKT